MNYRIKQVAAAGFVLMACLASSSAGTKTWNTTSGEWFVSGNWTPSGYPASTDNVVIADADANVLLTNSTTIARLTLGNATGTPTLTFSNWNTTLTVVSNVFIQTNGTITLPPAFTNTMMSNNIYIDCSNLTVDVGGSINANAKGYSGALVKGPGYGPGTAANPYGAGYGGRGGEGYGLTYGSTNAPVAPGSGGGMDLATGGHGGGAIRIAAGGAVTVNGVITANGGNGEPAGSKNSGGGSGGAIYITCRTFAGTDGIVSTIGGTGSLYGAGGGGGRIAVVYDTDAQSAEPVPTVQFSARGGLGWYVANGYETRDDSGDIGTLYFPDNQFLTTTVRDYTGQWITPGFTNWSVDNLTVSNCWIRFPSLGVGFQLTVTNDVKILGSSGRLDLGDNEQFINGVMSRYSVGTNGPVMNVGRDLILTNNSRLYIFSAMTNVNTGIYGAMVSVTGDLFVAEGCWIYTYSHPTNGVSVLFQASNVTVQATGGFNADTKGYSGRTVAGYGYGPGAGTSRYGGGYGGAGGVNPGSVYGSPNAPVQAGSAGGSKYNDSPGGSGGGLVRIQATGVVTVDGAISANGESRGTGGGGSGGAVYITCNTFVGSNGVVRVNGADGGSDYHSGGGGGRIAVIYDPAAQSALPVPSVQFSAAGGQYHPTVSGSVSDGDIGTLYFPDNRFLAETILHDGQWLVPGFTNWSPNNLTISNHWIRFPAGGFQLTVTNNIMVMGSSGKLEFGGNAYYINCWWPYSEMTARPIVHVGGNLTLTNGACFSVYSTATNASVSDYGALVDVTGDLYIGSNCWIYPFSHPTNGGSALFRVMDLTIAAGGGIDADCDGISGIYGSQPQKGYVGSADDVLPGYGPGGGATSGGGGYGGQGGNGNYGAGGPCCGNSNAPVDPGSAGGGYSTGKAGSGGGSVRIQTRGLVTVDGTITANGGAGGWYNRSGGGSGGGIFITCSGLAGSSGGLFRANGGLGGQDSGGGSTGGGGGGGRIALYYSLSDAFSGSITVDPGAGPFDPGETGTVRRSALGVATLISPNEGANVALKPAFKVNLTDNDGDWLKMKIELAKNSNFTSGLLVYDQTSSQTGFSGQNAQGNTAYTNGTTATFIPSTRLPYEGKWYWRAYAIDPAGTTVWGLSSETRSLYAFESGTVIRIF